MANLLGMLILLAQTGVAADDVGKWVTLRGQAADAKAGAVIAGAYVKSLDAWPQDLAGKQVVVSGFLVQERYFPEATIGPRGEISQGVAPGSPPELVLEDAAFSLAQPAAAGPRLYFLGMWYAPRGMVFAAPTQRPGWIVATDMQDGKVLFEKQATTVPIRELRLEYPQLVILTADDERHEMNIMGAAWPPLVFKARAWSGR